MQRVASREFQQSFGHFLDDALRSPFSITRNGRDRLVLMAVAEFERLKGRDRRVLAVERNCPAPKSKRSGKRSRRPRQRDTRTSSWLGMMPMREPRPGLVIQEVVESGDSWNGSVQGTSPMPHARRSCVLALPEALRRNALAEGDAGRRWISDLDVIVAEVTTALELEVNSAFARSSESLVLEVSQANGNRAVLKLGRPGVDLRRETEVCRMANGRILPKVLAHHPEFNALLLEALGRPISELGWSVDAQMRAICRTLETLWHTPTNGTGLVKGSDRAHGMRKLIDMQSRSLDASSDVATRNRAFDYAAERADAHRDDASVFVHGDAHPKRS